MGKHFLSLLAFLIFSNCFAQNKTVLYYASDKNTPFSRYEKSIDSLVSIIKRDSSIKVNITGHADSTGDAKHNMELSKHRAEEVYSIFISKGISPKRVTFLGLGHYNPLVNNKTEENRQKNRRVEIELSKLKKPKLKSIPSTSPIAYPYTDGYLQGELTVRNKSIKISISDWSIVDGDVITVIVNDKTFLSNYSVTEKKESFTVDNLKEGENIIEIVAINQGFVGVASPDIEVSDGKVAQHFNIKAEIGHPGAYKIKVEL